NRLVSVTQAGVPYAYAYDYRSRRVTRVEDGFSTEAIFSGGLSALERQGGVTTAEFLRGRDMGGGVGGLLYSIRSGAVRFSHSNSRGDVVAQTDSSGALSYQSIYEAYGQRTLENGFSSDRQKANTKEEDPTGLLNEGFRYRDLELGCFINRDPAGFVDGPNLYAYVRQNPWSKFDPEGLWLEDVVIGVLLACDWGL
ncbi:MAG: RHS repeat-associated core domain-containing protein, partial [Verrucomicrobiaceae bacterium]